MNDNWRDEILGLVDKYRESHTIAEATLANRIVGDADFFDRLKDGKGCTVDTYLKVKNWFQTNTPKKPKRSTN